MQRVFRFRIIAFEVKIVNSPPYDEYIFVIGRERVKKLYQFKFEYSYWPGVLSINYAMEKVDILRGLVKVVIELLIK